MLISNCVIFVTTFTVDLKVSVLYMCVYLKVRKAMNKSFMESGGTVLSTNWSEIGKEKVTVLSLLINGSPLHQRSYKNLLKFSEIIKMLLQSTKIFDVYSETVELFKGHTWFDC